MPRETSDTQTVTGGSGGNVPASDLLNSVNQMELVMGNALAPLADAEDLESW